MKVDSFQCDVCGKMRNNDVNRWWTVDGGRLSCAVSKFDPASEVSLGERHCCGEDCAIQLVQRWMATGNFDRPTPKT